MTGITDIGASAAQQSQTEDESDEYDEYERFDLSGCHFGKQHPVSAVRGEAVALRKLYDENDPDRSDVAVVLDNPSIVTNDDGLEDTVVVHSDEDTGDDFKVVNTADGQTKVPSDSMIDFAGNTFYGDIADDFGDMEQIALKRGGGAGRRISTVLDVNGATSARARRDDDGEIVLHDGGHPEHNGGLVEYHPDGRDGERPRYARDTELRPDVAGQDVVIMLQRLEDVDPDYEGPAYWATVFAQLPDDEMQALAEQYTDGDDEQEPSDVIAEIDGDEFINLQPTAEFEPSEPLMRATSWLEWQTLDYDDPDDLATLNEKRAEMGLDAYEPSGSSGSSDTEEAEA